MIDELANWTDYTKVFAGLLALRAPPIVVPIYLGLVAGRTMREKRQTAAIGVLVFGITMWLFIFFSAAILNTFGISTSAFRMAGGLLLMLIALDMMRSKPIPAGPKVSSSQISSAFAAGIVPLAIPVLTGPAALATVIVFANNHDGLAHKFAICLVIVALMIYLFVLLQIVAVSEKYISRNATLIFNKVTGLIICAIAFEFFFHGIAEHFPQIQVVH